MGGESLDQNRSLIGHRSAPKVSVGTKRGISEVEETSESSEKRTKMRDLESVFRSESQAVIGGSKTLNQDTYSDSREIDLNIDANPTSRKAKALDLDLNAEDISSSMNGPFLPNKTNKDSKSGDDFECRSSVGPLDRNDSLRVWKGLKQNNYMSTLYGSAPPSIPKPRGRKKVNNDAMKKKMELAKKEQVHRFARVAAPSGLLNGLNPGIINHVRNSKQVHSIIEALVRSEKNENRHSGSKKSSHDVNSSGVDRSGLCHGDGLMGIRQMSSDYGLFANSDSSTRNLLGNEDDKLGLKLLPSVTVGSDNISCLSNDESGNLSNVSSLSVEAANVASQWLELLNQDIRGRLSALRRSKKRVQAVITTELPFLMSREFSSNPEKDGCHYDQAVVNAHSVRWRTLFAQMDGALSEEESQLESWLNQVKEMQLHCDKGLHKNSLYNFSQQTVRVGNDGRSGASDKIEKDLAIRGAAASIYSTCNFLLSQ
ncbi:hypothetical protein OROMI_027117 [Orobanche minor]